MCLVMLHPYISPLLYNFLPNFFPKLNLLLIVLLLKHRNISKENPYRMFVKHCEIFIKFALNIFKHCFHVIRKFFLTITCNQFFRDWSFS